MTVSRRDAALIIAAAASQLGAQNPPPAPKPAAAKSDAPADQDLQDARANLRGAGLQVARVKLPFVVEPAFKFRA